MAAYLNVCRFLPTLGGTTDWTYSVAVTGYQSPTAAGVVNGTLYKYRAESGDLTQWELGEGAYNTGTGVLARTTVLFNSLGTTAKINFTVAPQVAIVALKEDLPNLTTTNAFTDTTDSTNTTTGSMTLLGGFGVGKAMSVGGPGLALGLGGAGANQAILFMEGGSGSAGGGYISFRKAGTAKFYTGAASAILGSGTSDNYILYSNGFGGTVFTVDFTTGDLTLASFTAATSSTSGSLKTAGGLGVAKAIYGGAEIATGATTVASLPAAAAGTKGARHFVTDATAAMTAGIGAVVTGGGANNVPVYCDGTNWRIG